MKRELDSKQEDFGDTVRKQLARILASPGFATSGKRSRFLSYLVEVALQRRNNDLNEYAIGIDVFGRPESFDPRLDSVVRVYATQVRKTLSDYYETLGRTDPILIELPAGQYTPIFSVAFDKATALKVSATEVPPTASELLIAVLPISAVPDGDFALSAGIADELISALVEIEGITVLAGAYCFAFSHRSRSLASASVLGVKASLEISARRPEKKASVITRLFLVQTGRVMWVARFESKADDLVTAQESVARSIATALDAEVNRGLIR